MHIRDATDADLAGILEIYNDAVLNTTAIWNEKTVDLDNRRAWLAERNAQGYPVLVAVDEQERFAVEVRAQEREGLRVVGGGEGGVLDQRDVEPGEPGVERGAHLGGAVAGGDDEAVEAGAHQARDRAAQDRHAGDRHEGLRQVRDQWSGLTTGDEQGGLHDASAGNANFMRGCAALRRP